MSINHKKGHTDKRNKNYTDHPSYRLASEKYDCCMEPDTPWRSVKSSMNALGSILLSGHTKKPTLVVNTRVGKW